MGDALVGEAEGVRRRLEGLLDQAPADSPRTVADSLTQMAEQGVALVDIVLRTLQQMPAASTDAIAVPATALALSRATVESAVQQVLVTVPTVNDDLARAALKTRAQGLSQRARKVEVELLRVMASSSQA